MVYNHTLKFADHIKLFRKINNNGNHTGNLQIDLDKLGHKNRNLTYKASNIEICTTKRENDRELMLFKNNAEKQPWRQTGY